MSESKRVRRNQVSSRAREHTLIAATTVQLYCVVANTKHTNTSTATKLQRVHTHSSSLKSLYSFYSFIFLVRKGNGVMGNPYNCNR